MGLRPMILYAPVSGSESKSGQASATGSSSVCFIPFFAVSRSVAQTKDAVGFTNYSSEEQRYKTGR